MRFKTGSWLGVETSISRLRFMPDDFAVTDMEDSFSSRSDWSSERMEVLSSCRTGCAMDVDLPIRIVAPALACSREFEILLFRVWRTWERNLEMTALRIGWTTIVSSSTDVASVVASLLEDGAGLSSSDWDLELPVD